MCTPNVPLKLSTHKMLRAAKALKNWSRSLFRDAKMQFYMARELALRFDVAQESCALTAAETNMREHLQLYLLGLAAILSKLAGARAHISTD